MSKTFRRIPFWIAREDKLDPSNAGTHGHDGGPGSTCGAPFNEAPKGFDKWEEYWGPLKKVVKRRTAHIMRARSRKIVRSEVAAYFLAREQESEDLNQLQETDWNDYDPMFDDDRWVEYVEDDLLPEDLEDDYVYDWYYPY